MWKRFDAWRARTIDSLQSKNIGLVIACLLALTLSPMLLGWLFDEQELGQTVQSVLVMFLTVFSLTCTWRDHLANKEEFRKMREQWDDDTRKNFPPFDGF